MIKVNKTVIEKLGLCSWPAWLPEEVGLSSVNLVVMKADHPNGMRGLVREVEDFLKALHHACPSLAQKMICNIYVDYLPVFNLVEVFRCYVVDPENGSCTFFRKLANVIKEDKKALALFTQPKVPDFREGDVVASSGNTAWNYYLTTDLERTAKGNTYGFFAWSQAICPKTGLPGGNPIYLGAETLTLIYRSNK